MNESSSRADEPEQPPPWLRACLKDLDGLDFEVPIAGSLAADCAELVDLYGSSARISAAEDSGDLAKVRVWNMLSAIVSMHFKPEDANEPFGPMLVLADGNRSAVASDFRNHLDVLQKMAAQATNVVLRARLNDLTWLLDRKRPACGAEAIKAYVQIVREIEAGCLNIRDAPTGSRFHHGTREYLLRALGIARMLGWGKPEALAAQAELVSVRKLAVAACNLVPVQWFCGLDLQTRVSDPREVAAEVDYVLANLPEAANHHVVVNLWQLAARAHHQANQEEDEHRCQEAAAEVMVAQAGRVSSSMLASDLIGNAISALHGLPNARARRQELRHRLLDLQLRVGEEMSTFSQEVDLSALAEQVRENLAPLSFFDGLFAFALLDRSPNPIALRREAAEAVREFPLSSLFGTAHLDDEGKVIHRTSGGGNDLTDPDDPVVVHQIAQREGARRLIVSIGKIEAARQSLTSQHYISDDVLYALTNQSPFVPPDLAQTFARGFTRFFQGDFTSALYTLTPLLENSLRYVLKSAGHDVTTFDNAAQTQEDRTISSLFEHMRSELDAVFTHPITEDIERVFLKYPGPALRHGIAHGLLHDGSPYTPDGIYACWLIYRLCLLPLLPYRRELGLD